MRNVIFVAPFSLETSVRFAMAAAEHPRIRLALLSQDPIAKFPVELGRRLAAHWRVDDIFDLEQLVTGVEALRRKVGDIHRVLGTLEELQVLLAEVRERLGIEGMGPGPAKNFRDKSLMKERLRQAGLPCARHRLIRAESDALEFVREVGFPVVVKPPAGAGARATFAVENNRALRKLLALHPPRAEQPLLGEEFIQGTEHSFDGFAIKGELAWHSLTHYLPNPLEVVRTPWIQWCVLLPREIDDPAYDDIREVAAKALDVLGLGTGVCHLEWFRRPDGSIAISEVAARPAGAQITKLISYAHDLHFYRAWARLMIEGTFTPPKRRYAAGAAFLRGQGDGRVKNIYGLGQAQEELGPLVVETNLPKLGQSPSGSYEGEGYVILRHPETERVREALSRLVSLIRVELG